MSLHIEGTRKGDMPLYWPTWAEWSRWALKCAGTILVALVAFTGGSATMAGLYLDGRQEVLNERARTDRCVAHVAEGVRLTLDATLAARMALARSMAPRAEPRRTYTVDAGPIGPP